MITTKDAPDAISLLQSLAGSTFDSSQLVLTACMGFLTVTEDRLQALREKHRPAVLAAVEEMSKGVQVWKDSKSLATKLYSFKHKPEPRVEEASGEKPINGDVSCSETHSADLDKMLAGLNIDSDVDSLPGLQEQVVCFFPSSYQNYWSCYFHFHRTDVFGSLAFIIFGQTYFMLSPDNLTLAPKFLSLVVGLYLFG